MATTKKTTSSAANTSGSGINVDGIPKMEQAIKEYIDTVKKKCNIEASKEQIQGAIKGTNAEAALVARYDAIDVEMQNLVGTLEAYNQDLENIKAQYEKHDAASDFSSSK